MNIGRVVETQWRSVMVVFALLAIGGIIGMTRVPMSLFPQTNFPRIVIVVENGEMPAQQMLVSITKPVEESMSGIPGIARIRSISSRGAAEIDLFFDWRSDIEKTLLTVQSRLSQMATKLPPGATVKRVERLTFAVFPILGYSVTSTRRDPGTLRTLAELTIRPPLARVPGVASVDVQGGEVPEVHVRLDPARLESRGLTVSQVVDVVVKPYYDQSLLVRAAVGSVRDAILIGLLLSVLILYGFLRSWGTTLVATVVIPVTILVTILAMWLVGLSFDLMTLGGVAAAIGLVIDDAIVVVENIYRHVAAGASRIEAVHLAMGEITAPIVFSTITPVVVFLP